MPRDWLGGPLVPGVNADKLSVAAGIDAGTELGFESAEDEMVTQYALLRWARGEEAGAEATWLRRHPRDLTSWRVILATAMAAGVAGEGEKVENSPAWGKAEKVVDKVLWEDHAAFERAAGGGEPVVGLSLAAKITGALREAGLLKEEG